MKLITILILNMPQKLRGSITTFISNYVNMMMGKSGQKERFAQLQNIANKVLGNATIGITERGFDKEIQDP